MNADPHNLKDHDLLVRIDERTQSMVHQMNGYEERLDNFRKTHVTQKEFVPVKTISYGLIAIAAVAVLGAVINLVVEKGGV